MCFVELGLWLCVLELGIWLCVGLEIWNMNLALVLVSVSLITTACHVSEWTLEVLHLMIGYAYVTVLKSLYLILCDI